MMEEAQGPATTWTLRIAERPEPCGTRVQASASVALQAFADSYQPQPTQVRHSTYRRRRRCVCHFAASRATGFAELRKSAKDGVKEPIKPWVGLSPERPADQIAAGERAEQAGHDGGRD
jgi:hypothetical protein